MQRDEVEVVFGTGLDGLLQVVHMHRLRREANEAGGIGGATQCAAPTSITSLHHYVCREIELNPSPLFRLQNSAMQLMHGRPQPTQRSFLNACYFHVAKAFI